MIECPYCGYEDEDPDDCYETGDLYFQECCECGKNFTFTLDYSVNYYPKKAPCLNGSNHKIREQRGVPECLFKGKFECVYCNKQKDTIDPKVRKGWWDDYMKK